MTAPTRRRAAALLYVAAPLLTLTTAVGALVAGLYLLAGAVTGQFMVSHIAAGLALAATSALTFERITKAR